MQLVSIILPDGTQLNPDTFTNEAPPSTIFLKRMPLGPMTEKPKKRSRWRACLRAEIGLKAANEIIRLHRTNLRWLRGKYT